MADVSVLRLFKTEDEEKTFGADFQRWGPIKAGETIDDPASIVIDIQAGSGLTLEGEDILDVDFVDAAGGKKIPAGKGVKFKLSGGTPGTYLISIKARSSVTLDLMDIVGELTVRSSV